MKHRINPARFNQGTSHTDKDTSQIIAASSSDYHEVIENVLILQGGGSLGAFGCGVFKALCQKGIKLDIVAGTSIGSVNAAIIAGGKNVTHPEQLLEEFWLELAENFVDLDSFTPFSPYLEQLAANSRYFPSISQQSNNESERMIEEYRNKAIKSFFSSAMFGNDKMFKARWRPEYAFTDPEYFQPAKWTYLYDLSPLAKTLERYIDYNKLKPDGNPNSRLIMTAVNVLTAEPLTFDSSRLKITPKHILASCGYPAYNFPWVEVEKGIYAWDGGLLSNTPLREVIDSSPVNDKEIFLVENYPKKINALPNNLAEVYHRTRDIIFCDKTLRTVAISKAITRYLRYIDELYQMIEDSTDMTKVDKGELEKIRRKYKKYKIDTGAEIKGVHYISRDEPVHSFYENADFSPKAIRDSIKQGELKTTQILDEVAKTG
ncbi:MAG: patatin-like phospholipase family protein [Nitrososphaeraceae archaeon]|nr:patatin-like phospholipase family protein [Nitrososphaeraceae archaeon]MDW0194226.1 patatin-like phospholipase family protein [Nitrososphaeraceae archaeon]MDW0220589.1 patatin-like phospholipase family protein [Nitrososphaeraceae archaeon]MDW0249783.1 patatin-like phospholipase family protein [Nitrososphaeraceae archaeon]MDW0261649.1 patatin-like phospholipase family protein [Nitrososphaeraceae archaeon]